MKRIRSNTLLFLAFFSLSGSVDSDPPSRQTQPIVQALVSVDDTSTDLHLEELSVDTILAIQNQVLERHIQQADDMGTELDRIIQILEE